MVLRPKPDSSYASNRLTRNNPPRKHLLSTYRNRDNGTGKNEAPPKPEPATDDEPLSSSDEDIKLDPESESDNEVKPRVSEEKLEAKIAKSSPKSEQELQPPSSSKSARQSKTRGTIRKRASTGSAIHNENANEDAFAIWQSSEAPKKRRVTGYGSRSNRTSDVSMTIPRSSMASVESETPPASARKAMPKTNQKAETTSAKKKKAPVERFKVPMDIDIDSPAPSTSKSRPRPEFKLPPFPADGISSSSFATSSAREPPTFDFDDDDSPLSTPLSSASSTLMQQFADLDDEILAVKGELEEFASKDGSFCPMCKQPVDPELLMRFQAQPKQRIRDQQRFCESHKQKSAEAEWQEKGYPSIDWDKFDDRIHRHFDYIDTLLVSESPSYYRNILDATLKSGKAKNFKLTLSGDGLETISCGYYGTRGSDKMYGVVLVNPLNHPTCN